MTTFANDKKEERTTVYSTLNVRMNSMPTLMSEKLAQTPYNIFVNCVT